VDNINKAIAEMLSQAKEKHDDMNDKIELLKKVEVKFLELYEARNNAVSSGKETAILDIEKKLRTKHRTDKQHLNQQKDEEENEDKKRRQEKKTEQKELMLNSMGRQKRIAARSTKKKTERKDPNENKKQDP
jgi:hypothetical protein